VPIPDRRKRLVVVLETQRCAADAVQAITGCRPGRRTLQFRDYGKLAATFIDVPAGRAIRVAARADLRQRALDFGESGEERQQTQRRAYLALPPGELFSVEAVPFELDPFDRPGPPSRRVNCAACGEEVSDGREVAGPAASLCRPCAALDAPSRRFVA
jgi:formylmethanofuran dehydrogenase subunit E